MTYFGGTDSNVAGIAKTHPLVWADGQRVVPLGAALPVAFAGLIGLLGAEHPFVVQVPGKGAKTCNRPNGRG